jgi:hypothetical protein
MYPASILTSHKNGAGTSTTPQLEVATKMIQQAKRHSEYQLLAGAYMAQIIAMPTDQNQMAPEFHTDNLALNFESNKQTNTEPTR